MTGSLGIAMAAGLLGVSVPAAHAANPTIVSFTFDDGNSDQLPAAAKLKSAGMAGTFFLNSGFLNGANHLTSAQAQALQADGHEIGGHTVTHADLAQVGPDELKRQVCNDRVTLTSLGLKVANFAYPFASTSAEAQAAVAACGYNSARGLGDIKSKVPGTETFPVAETIPPESPFLTKAPDQLDNTWTLADMQNLVTNAQNGGGGWVQLTFHHVGDGVDPSSGVADPLSVSTANFNAFVDWVDTQKANATSPVQVKTVAAVIGGAVKPVVNGPAAPAPQTAGNLIKNPSLETPGLNGSTVPRCWQEGGYGANTRVFSRVVPGHAGTTTASEQLVLSAHTSGSGALLPYLDTGECAPSAAAGHSYRAMAWYKATTTTQFDIHYRTGTGSWVYWTSSPYFPASSTWVQASWDTGAVPAGATAISVGLNLINNGTLTTDDYELYDLAGVKTFSDVSSTNQFNREISWLSNNLITQGYPDGTFRPVSSISREAMAAFLYRLAGSPAVPSNAPTFVDVPAGSQFYNEIRWLASKGMTTGWPDGTFRPGNPVNRDAMAAFLYRYNGKPAVPASAPSFPDVTQSNMFYNEIRWLAATQITTGYPDGLFRPVQPINRDAMAAFIYRYNLNFPKLF
ncbi:S-layer homology domain-containing protein [Pseudarthrobacter sp. L19]|uniref:S-layer homology domain-containing protein n=1 Tax=Pseudarthrobacter sp. L19 TaxID=3423951 RepID=UPI003D7AC342